MEIFLPLPDAPPVILNALAQSQRYETLEATHHLSQPILGAAFSPFSAVILVVANWELRSVHLEDSP
jgi:hypothetical protein